MYVVYVYAYQKNFMGTGHIFPCIVYGQTIVRLSMHTLRGEVDMGKLLHGHHSPQWHEDR